ncbi:MAG: glycosyl transferase, group 1, partial [Segetibacter sp.]|nr:glycosyl transferase, group 1 [Segetibacter sp.]
LYETFGLTIIESMSAGVPVIGFNIGTRPELIDHGKTGFITSPDLLADTILMSYEYPGHDIMSVNAINFATSFDTERILAQQVGIYQQLIHPV